MSERATIDAAIDAASRAQKRVATPRASAWVSANAGSGKTRVLTERVARLLLHGAEPSRILCLTYTRAAAAEMANRLSALLGDWALLPEAELRARLASIDADGDATALSPDALARARRLFARALETPGGLKIQTIHAFCGMALRRFPLEARVPPDFTELDAAAREELLRRAVETVATAAERGADDAFDGVAAELGEEALKGLVEGILAKRALFPAEDTPAAYAPETKRVPYAPETKRAPLERDAATARICTAFGIREETLSEDPVGVLLATRDRATLTDIAMRLSAGTVSDQALGEAIGDAVARGDAAALVAAFHTKEGAPRQLSRVPTKATAEANPSLREALHALAEAAFAARDRAEAIAGARRAIVLNRFGSAVLKAYESAKRARGALDFDDLIARTLALLEDPGAGAWALWKLDGGIDHLLVDEAQDTSPAQWRLIRALTAEIASGGREGRTLFVVGDEKQSIYSFQGADPGQFGEQAAWFEAMLAGAPRPLIRGEMLTSFRSSPTILEAVDQTFARATGGLNASGAAPRHVSAYPDRRGRVDLWPVLEKGPESEEPPWHVPRDMPPPDDPANTLAGVIAAEVARMCRDAEPLPGAGRAVVPGDVLILLRRRGKLAPALVKALKREGLPVAGADRLRIAKELAVRDLLALARATLTTQDSLSLAAVLRSPLCDVSEDELFALAHGRADGAPLWLAVRDSDAHAETAAFLDRMADRADFLRPFEFFDAALTLEGGRYRLLERLGMEAEEAIDELLAQALVYEASHTPSLEGFLAWIEKAGIDIKREQDTGGGAVRVMTVHGAKGLEAPLVILPDSLGHRPPSDPVLALPGNIAAWRGGRAAAIEAAKDALAASAVEESRRLLYVAMTRAENWLIVVGAGARPKNGETWHGLVEQGLEALGATSVPGPAGLTGPVRRAERGEDPAPSAETPGDAPPPPTAVDPPWLREDAGRRPPAPTRLAASALGGAPNTGEADGTGDGDGSDHPEAARLRGVVIHALLEELPGLAIADRAAHATRRARQMAPLQEDAHTDWITEAFGVLDMPALKPFLGPDALAEAPLSWSAPTGARIGGRLDRLLVGETVAALDFKTDARPPSDAAAVPEGYLRQMAVYEAALATLYPSRPISVTLLWTRTRQWMTLPTALIAAARGRLLDPAKGTS